MDNNLQITLISTNTEIGKERRGILIPKLKDLGITPSLYIGNEISTHGYVNLFNKVKHIIRYNIDKDYIIIMEDDCTFRTKKFVSKLEEHIQSCKELNISALLTGSSKVVGPVVTSKKDLITLSSAHNTQLIVVFKELYDKILEFPVNHNWDMILTSMSQLSDVKIGLTLPYLTGQLKSGKSSIKSYRGKIGERFEIEEKRLINLL